MAQANDPVAVRQWVVCVGLVLEAENAARSGSSIDRAIALITADTAIEAMLGLMSSRVLDPLDTHSFGTYLKRAAAVSRMPDHDHRELNAIHKIRNGAIHTASGVSADDVLRATSAARRVLDTYVPRVLKQTRALGPGRGLADAVASVIEPHPIAHWLSAAQQAVAKRQGKEALQASARAFVAVKHFATPGLPSTHSHVDGMEVARQLGALARGKDTRLEARVNDLSSGVRQLESWVVPIALGLSPPEYQRLQSDLPRLRGEDQIAVWEAEHDPDLGTATRSLELISTIALRLSLNEMLRYPHPDWRGTTVWDEIARG
jgi:hypothetical protein